MVSVISIQYSVFGFKKFIAFVLLTRPLNVLISGLSILLAASLATPVGVRPLSFSSAVACAMISTMLITAGANAINDWFDLEIDKINRPRRMLPARRLTPRAARSFAIFLFACGNFFSIFISSVAVMIAVASSFLLIVYTPWFKRQPLSGNLVVSAVSAMAFIYGAYAAEIGMARLEELAFQAATALGAWNVSWRAGIFPAVFAFLFHFGREVVKDLEDQAGDRAVQARTLPLAYGLQAAQIAATIAFVLLSIATLVPFYIGLYGSAYLWITLLGVDSVLLFALYFLWKQPERHRMRQVSAALKAGMFLGLAAIYMGR
jgi:geranylgeranylglycerol-phosphate geranylgeranyltransferase